MNQYENIKYIDESWSTQTYDSWDKIATFVLECLDDWEKGHPYTNKMVFAIKLLQESLLIENISKHLEYNQRKQSQNTSEDAPWLMQTK